MSPSLKSVIQIPSGIFTHALSLINFYCSSKKTLVQSRVFKKVNIKQYNQYYYTQSCTPLFQFNDCFQTWDSNLLSSPVQIPSPPSHPQYHADNKLLQTLVTHPFDPFHSKEPQKHPSPLNTQELTNSPSKAKKHKTLPKNKNKKQK